MRSMASLPTHFVVGAAISTRRSWIVTSGLFAILPDFDTLLMQMFGIPYGSFLGHRGFFHSPFFLCALAFLCARRLSPGLMWAAAAISHPLLDAMTDGGLGIMLLFPLSTERYFLPWRPIHVSPLGIAAFFEAPGHILLSELPFCAAAALAGIILRYSLKKV